MSILPMDMVPITFGFVKDVRVTRLWSSSTVSCWLSFNQPTDIGYRLEWNYPFQPCRPSFYNFSFGCAVSFFTAVHSCEKHPAFLSDPVSAFPYGHFFTPSFSGGYSSHPQLCVLSLLHSDWNDPLRQYTLNECRSVFAASTSDIGKVRSLRFFCGCPGRCFNSCTREWTRAFACCSLHLVLIFHHCFSNEAIIIFPLQR